MSAAFQIQWTAFAVRDLEAIADYIAQDAPTAADRLVDNIETQVDKLSSLPNRGRVVPELQDSGITLFRELVIEKWRVLYRITNNCIYILAIIDARRKVEDILFEKLLRHNSANEAF